MDEPCAPVISMPAMVSCKRAWNILCCTHVPQLRRLD
jgi:hypothetical protein